MIKITQIGKKKQILLYSYYCLKYQVIYIKLIDNFCGINIEIFKNITIIL